jgi:hypothetical protein
MSIVFVNDWNGYGGGIFDTFENALEDMAILALDGGTERHQDHAEDFGYLVKPLQDIGFGGNRNDRNLYAIVKSESYEHFSIQSYDTSTRPGHVARTSTLASERMIHPAWAVQKALYDCVADEVLTRTIREELVGEVRDMVARATADDASPEEALAVVRGTGIPALATAVHRELFPATVENPLAFLHELGDRAGDVFDEIVTKAFPSYNRAGTVAP